MMQVSFRQKSEFKMLNRNTKYLIVINQVFQRKSLVFKMMNVDGRVVGRASAFSFRSITPKALAIITVDSRYLDFGYPE